MLSDYLRWLAACFAALLAGIIGATWLLWRFGDEPRNAADSNRAMERRKGSK